MNRKREEVWDKSSGHCWYCGIPLLIGDAKSSESRALILQWFVIDHVIPKTHGGSNQIENLVSACWLCNSTKGNKSVEQFRLYLAMREAGMPYFTQEQIAWLETQGFTVKNIAPIQFWAERHELTITPRKDDGT